MNNNQIEHLKMIQSIIDRMARNSFMYKGWSLSVFAALLILSSEQYGLDLGKAVFDLPILLGIFPLIGFWGLDAYYLKQERLFRKLYDFVRLEVNETDFSMNTSLFSNTENWFKLIFSKSVLWLYLPMVILVIIKSGI